MEIGIRACCGFGLFLSSFGAIKFRACCDMLDSIVVDVIYRRFQNLGTIQCRGS